MESRASRTTSIVQPFSQLGRELFVACGRTKSASATSRVSSTPRPRAAASSNSAVVIGARIFGARLTEYTKELPCGAAARFEVAPAVSHGGDVDQKFTIASRTCTYALDRLPPIDYSELMRDLEYARIG